MRQATDDPPRCEFCHSDGGEVVWRDDYCRVVLADDRNYPALCRVILNRHVVEMTDLRDDERMRLMNVVFAVEAALRALLRPDKINLASLGNQVPHLHWHVVPRFRDDRHFPAPIWASPTRAAGAAPVLEVERLRERLAMTCGGDAR